MTNPNQDFFMWGVSAKREYAPGLSYQAATFYGCSAKTAVWYLNGSYCPIGERNGRCGDKIRKRIDTKHFAKDNIEVDLYLDCDKGIFRLCVVGMDIDINNEVEITGLNNVGNEDGWVPHVLFIDHSVVVRCCSIQAEFYGQKMDFQWV